MTTQRVQHLSKTDLLNTFWWQHQDTVMVVRSYSKSIHFQLIHLARAAMPAVAQSPRVYYHRSTASSFYEKCWIGRSRRADNDVTVTCCFARRWELFPGVDVNDHGCQTEELPHCDTMQGRQGLQLQVYIKLFTQVVLYIRHVAMRHSKK